MLSPSQSKAHYRLYNFWCLPDGCCGTVNQMQLQSLKNLAGRNLLGILILAWWSFSQLTSQQVGINFETLLLLTQAMTTRKASCSGAVRKFIWRGWQM